jgi:hypothetical protein
MRARREWIQALRGAALGLGGVHAGQQPLQRQAHGLLGLQAQHAGHGRVGQRHVALRVQAQDGVGRGVDDGGGAFLAAPQRLQLLLQRGLVHEHAQPVDGPGAHGAGRRQQGRLERVVDQVDHHVLGAQQRRLGAEPAVAQRGSALCQHASGHAGVRPHLRQRLRLGS